MVQRPLATFDGNILVHAARAGDPRQDAALEPFRLAAGGRCVLALQALGAFFFAATRERLATRPSAAARVRRWMTLSPSPATASASAVVAAVDAAAEGRFSYWGALLFATAAEGAASGSIRVVPAFAGDGGVHPAARALL